MIQYNLESGERDLSNGKIGFRVYDLEIAFVKVVGWYPCLSTWGNRERLLIFRIQCKCGRIEKKASRWYMAQVFSVLVTCFEYVRIL